MVLTTKSKSGQEHVELWDHEGEQEASYSESPKP